MQPLGENANDTVPRMLQPTGRLPSSRARHHPSFRHDLRVPEPEMAPEQDLDQIRKGIDDVDRRLVRLLAERASLVQEVVHYKRRRHIPVVDRAREDRMLARIADVARDEGLDPRVAQQVLRTIIDGFTLLEVEELGPDA